MKIGTIVSATIEAGAHEVLLTPFIESVENSLTLKLHVKLLPECYKVGRVLMLSVEKTLISPRSSRSRAPILGKEQQFHQVIFK